MTDSIDYIPDAAFMRLTKRLMKMTAEGKTMDPWDLPIDEQKALADFLIAYKKYKKSSTH